MNDHNNLLLDLLQTADENRWPSDQLLNEMMRLTQEDAAQVSEDMIVACVGALFGSIIDDLCGEDRLMAKLENPDRAMAALCSGLFGNNPTRFVESAMITAGVLMGAGAMEIANFGVLVKRSYSIAEETRAAINADTGETHH